MTFTFKNSPALVALVQKSYATQGKQILPYGGQIKGISGAKQKEPMLYLVHDAGVYLMNADLHKSVKDEVGRITFKEAGVKPRKGLKPENPISVLSADGEDFRLGGDDFVEAVNLPEMFINWSRVKEIQVTIAKGIISLKVISK